MFSNAIPAGPAMIGVLFLAGCHSSALERLEYSNEILTSFKVVHIELKNNCQISPSQRTDFMAISHSYFLTVRKLDGKDFTVLESDSDADGVSDAEETKHRLDFCSDPRKRDGLLADNYSDWINNFLKITCDLQQSLPPIAAGDDDGDGLSNADESLLKSNPRLWDTDGDGIPDSLEARAGTNALVPTTGSWAGDDKSDLEKIRLGLPIDRTLNADLLRYAHRYSAEVIPNESGLCYHDIIDNIPVVPGVGESNLIAFYQVSTSAETRMLEVRHLKVPSSLEDGTRLVVEWKDLEVSN